MKIFGRVKNKIKYFIYKSNGYLFELTIKKNNLSMVSLDRLINLNKQCKKFANSNYSFVECGVAKGAV